MAELTPMMQQFMEIKGKYPNCLLFFRLGDFYEMFFDDAVIASKELDIVLTGRDCGLDEKAPMCGVPYHAANGYIARLIEKGWKVAVCDQMEDPKLTKTLVKREVVRVITPGTVLDERVLDEGKNNYISCVFQDRRGIGVSFADVSTGEFLVTSFAEEKKAFDELGKFKPAEIIYSQSFTGADALQMLYGKNASEGPGWMFGSESAFKALSSHFKTLNLEGYGLRETEIEVNAAGALLSYLSETQKNSLSHMTEIKKYSHLKYMAIDVASRRNLELTETIREKSKKRSLLGFLDMTKTPLGARTLRKWIEQPLVNVKDIQNRLDMVEELKAMNLARDELRDYLRTVHDIERIVAMSVYQTANARDLATLQSSLAALPDILALASGFSSALAKWICSQFDPLEDMHKVISDTLIENPPFSVREGGFVKQGFNADLDRLRQAKDSGAQWLAELEEREKRETGIKSLKVRFNKVFGYYIELTNSHAHLAPPRYARRQTLANCERFITDELKKIEDEILGSEEKIAALEHQIFSELRENVASQAQRFQKTAQLIGALDALQSLAEAAERNRYCKPEVDGGGAISIKGGRHPVVEQMAGQQFVPNDTELDLEGNRMAVITGPNMAGKSTYMRQVALITLMAQAGSFVPADSAKIGVVDRIFTRVGASDDLATGQSTFMVEMTEVANILNNATRRSLLILDEIGRGTSTFDGLSIAWAVLEYIADNTILGAKTLFATHYHELTGLEGMVDGVKNYNAVIREQGDSIVFLRKIERGGADRSYGIQVASLAGLPEAVLERSKEILSDLSSAEMAKKAPPPSQTIRPYKRRKRIVAENQLIMSDVFGEGFF